MPSFSKMSENKETQNQNSKMSEFLRAKVWVRAPNFFKQKLGR